MDRGWRDGQPGSQQAAVETLKGGYDRHMILGGVYANYVGVFGYWPAIKNNDGYGTVSRLWPQCLC